MPIDFRGSDVVHMGPDTILKRPEIGLLFAAVVCQWRNIEENLELIYSQTLRALITKNRQSHGVTDILSGQIFDAMHTTTQKIAVLKAALRSLDDKEFYDRLSKLERRISSLGGERNKMVHSTWGVCDSRPNDIIIFQRDGMKVYRRSDFEDIISRMRTMSLSLISIVSDMPEAKLPGSAANQLHPSKLLV